MALVATIILIIITKDTFNKSSGLAKAAMISGLCQLIPHQWVWFPLICGLWLVPPIMLAVARGREGRFSPLDRAFLSLSFTAPVVNLMGHVGVYVGWTMLSFRAWLSTFDPDWPSRKSLPLKIVEYIREFESRLPYMPITRELFGMGSFEEMRGVTWVDAVYSFALYRGRRSWYYIQFWWSERPFSQVIEELKAKVQ